MVAACACSNRQPRPGTSTKNVRQHWVGAVHRVQLAWPPAPRRSAIALASLRGSAAWEDSWVPRSQLTADLREAGRLRPYAPRKRRSDAAAEAAAASRVEGTRRSARLAGGRLEVVEYVGGERVVVRRGGAGTAQMHAGAADGDVVDMGE